MSATVSNTLAARAIMRDPAEIKEGHTNTGAATTTGTTGSTTAATTGIAGTTTAGTVSGAPLFVLNERDEEDTMEEQQQLHDAPLQVSGSSGGGSSSGTTAVTTFAAAQPATSRYGESRQTGSNIAAGASTHSQLGATQQYAASSYNICILGTRV